MSKFHSMGWVTSRHAALAALVVAGCAQGPKDVPESVVGVSAEAELHALGTPDSVPEVGSAGVAEPTPLAADVRKDDGSRLAQPQEARPQEARPQEARPQETTKQDAHTAPAAERRMLDAAYFDTDEFQRQFATSFLRRSDVEPPLSDDEIETLQNVFELIRSDKRERALKKLLRENERFATPTVQYMIAQLRFEEAKAALDGGDQDEADRLYDVATEFYEAAITDFPKYLNAHHYLALVHFQRERYRDAANHFSAELRLGGVDKLTYGLLGISLMNQELYLPAETAFRSALLLDPFNQDWNLGLSRCLFKQQRYGEAATLVGGMIKEDPDRAELWLLQGNAYVGLKETERAAENFRIAEALGGATQQSLDLMADIYVNRGLGSLAVDSYLKAIAKSTSPSPARALRSARLMTQNGDTMSATRLLDGVSAALGDGMRDSDRDTVLKLRSKIAVLEGSTEDEITVLREIVGRNPLDGEAFVLLGEAHERAEQFDEAAQSFVTAAGVDGSGAVALRKHGEMLVRRRQYADAIPLLKGSLQLQERATLRDYLDAVEKAARRAAR